jgi:aminopeptidase N
LNQRPERRNRDWQPWAILGVLLVALAAIIWLNHRAAPELASRTAKTGLPLTREQRSVAFDTGDLTFDVQPEKRRIEGRAILGFTVKAPISKLQFDLDPELPIDSIAADGRTLARSAWANDGGLVTVGLPAAKRPGDHLTLTVAYGDHPHVAKREPWDGGFVWAYTKAG